MKVTAIIPSLYEVDKDYLKLCVESLRATVDWDIIVVTNGTSYKPDITSGTWKQPPDPKTGAQKAQPAIEGVTIHVHTPKQGQCNAVNIGAQLAAPDTDYLFISNSDMYYAPGWNEFLEFNLPCFSPNLVEPTDNTGSAEPFIKVNGGYNLSDFKKNEVDYIVNITKKDEQEAKTTVESGFNFPLFIKKYLWDSLKGYDIAYDPWGSNSDTDLQTRINLAGVTPMRRRDILVYHFSNKSGTFDGTHQDFYQNNIEYFKEKFGFDRDELGSDVWYNKDMIPDDKSKIKLKIPKYEA